MNSKIVGFDATIPTNASTGNHSIFASINATRIANAYSETTFTEIAVRSPCKSDFAANRLGCCMDFVLGLSNTRCSFESYLFVFEMRPTR
jgi:hypothetical protein